MSNIYISRIVNSTKYLNPVLLDRHNTKSPKWESATVYNALPMHSINFQVGTKHWNIFKERYRNEDKSRQYSGR